MGTGVRQAVVSDLVNVSRALCAVVLVGGLGLAGCSQSKATDSASGPQPSGSSASPSAGGSASPGAGNPGSGGGTGAGSGTGSGGGTGGGTAGGGPKAGAPVEYKEFAGRTHWLIAQDGWQEIAAAIETFVSGV